MCPTLHKSSPDDVAKCQESDAEKQEGRPAGEVRLKVKFHWSVFTVPVTVVVWSGILQLNRHSLDPRLVFFIFYEAEEAMCLHRWPIKEFSGDL